MEQTISAPVSFTPGAIEELRKLMDQPGFNKDQYLRVGVKGGGCSGFSYLLGFDEKGPQDTIYTYNDFSFIMNPSHSIYLMGMEINWEEGLNARGFTFSNPNASKTCGCGSSFGV